MYSACVARLLALRFDLVGSHVRAVCFPCVAYSVMQICSKADSPLECGLVSCVDCPVPVWTLSTLYLGLEPITDTDDLSSCHEEEEYVETYWCSEVDRSDDAWTTPERSEEYE